MGRGRVEGVLRWLHKGSWWLHCRFEEAGCHEPCSKLKLGFNLQRLWPAGATESRVVVVQSLSHVQLFATHGLQDDRLPCPSLKVCINSHPLSWWCHQTISFSVIPFSSCLQSFPASGSFPMNLLFASGGQRTEASALASVLPMYIQDWSFRIDWFDLLAVQGTLESLLQHHILKVSILWHSVFFMIQLSHPYQTTGKNIALTFVNKVMFLLFNMLSRFIIAFLPRSTHLLISSLKSPSAVLLEPKKIKCATVYIPPPPYICFPSDASGKEPSYQWR